VAKRDDALGKPGAALRASMAAIASPAPADASRADDTAAAMTLAVRTICRLGCWGRRDAAMREFICKLKPVAGNTARPSPAPSTNRSLKASRRSFSPTVRHEHLYTDVPPSLSTGFKA
jgi:hypothetical protein